MKTIRFLGILAMAWPMFGCSPDYPDAPVDPLSIERSDTGNDALHCPPEQCANADLVSHVFKIAASDLLESWQRVIESQPRTTIRAFDPERGLIHAEQRSKWLRFVDTILIRVEPLAEGSSYIVLSRSEFGRSDFGVNAERLQNWTKILMRELQAR